MIRRSRSLIVPDDEPPEGCARGKHVAEHDRMRPVRVARLERGEKFLVVGLTALQLIGRPLRESGTSSESQPIHQTQTLSGSALRSKF